MIYRCVRFLDANGIQYSVLLTLYLYRKMFSPTKLLVAAAILFIAYFLGNLSTTKFGLPRKQESPVLDSVLNVTLLGTNDLHSAFNGIGLSSYPESITGGYSKLVELIDTIR